jgi:hypothetical protein
MLGGQEKWVLLVLVGVAALGAADDASAGRRPAWPPTLLLGAVFLVVSAGSLLYAADRDLAGGAVIHQVVQMAALAAGFFWVRRASQANALVACLAVAGAVSAALGIWQFLEPAGFNGVFGRFTGLEAGGSVDLWGRDLERAGALWFHPGQYAVLLSALLPALLWLWFRRRHGVWTCALGAASGLTFVALALTGTRMTLVGGVLAALAFAVASRSRPERLSPVRSGILPILAGGLVLATVLSTQGSAESNTLGRVFYLFQGEGGASASVSGRQAIYGTLTDSWKAAPVLGVGLGNTRQAVERVTTYNTSPHSYWIGLLAETGLVGTGLVALMMAGMVPHYRRLLRRPPGSSARQFAAFALASSLALLAFGLVHGAMLTEWQTGVLFWLPQGAVLSLTVRSQDHTDGAIQSARTSRAEIGHAR